MSSITALLNFPLFPPQELEQEVIHLNRCRQKIRDKALMPLFKERITKNKDFIHLLYYFSLQKRFFKLAELLLKLEFPINSKEQGNGGTALHLSCYRNDLISVKWLLKHKADPNSKNAREETPFHFSCSVGAIDILRLLIKKGADPLTITPQGSGLHYAASFGHRRTCSYLLSKGLPIDGITRLRQTPIQIAWIEKQQGVFEYLIDKGSSINDFFSINKTHFQWMVEPKTVIPDQTIELKELITLFDNINFTDRKKPGYRNPKLITDDDMYSETNDFIKISVDKIKKGLEELIGHITNNTPWTGSPTDSEERKKWYADLENKLKVLINKFKTEKDPKDPTPYAQSLIEIGLSAPWCGGDNQTEIQLQFDLLEIESKHLKNQIYNHLRLFKRDLVSSLVDRGYKHNVNCFNAILQWIDGDAGVSNQNSYNQDHYAQTISAGLNQKEYLQKFYKLYTPESLLNELHSLINVKNVIDKYLVMDYLKDHIPLEKIVNSEGSIKRTGLLKLLQMLEIIGENP